MPTSSRAAVRGRARPRRRRSRAFADPAAAEWTTERKVELAKGIERAAREADQRVVAVETTVFVDEEQRVALASSSGLAGAYEATTAYAYLSAIAEDGGDRQTGLGFGMGRSPAALDAGGDRPRGRGALDLAARRRQARLAHLPRRPRRDRRGQLRRLHRRRPVRRRRAARALAVRRPPRRAVASAALTIADDGADPAGLNSAPFDGEGTPRGRTALIEAGELAAYLHDSYTARRERPPARLAPAPPPTPPAPATAPRRRSRPPTWSSPRAPRASTSCSPRRATASTSPTSPACTPASTRSPAPSRSAPPAA